MSKLVVANRFGVTPNHILNDKNLSFKAKGLFAYIQSKPDGWSFSVQRIEMQTKDGRDAISAGLKELEEAGYLRRVKHQDEKGQWEWEYLLTDKPLQENPLLDSPEIYSKQDIVKKISNKETFEISQKEDITVVVPKGYFGGNTALREQIKKEEYSVVAVSDSGNEISQRKKPSQPKPGLGQELKVFSHFRERCLAELGVEPEPAAVWQLRSITQALKSFSLDDLYDIIDEWVSSAPDTHVLNIHSALSVQRLNSFKLKK